MPEDALHKSAAASNENRVSKAPSQDSGQDSDGWITRESDAAVGVQSSLKSESLTKSAIDGDLGAGTTELHNHSSNAASGKTHAASSRLPDDPWANGYKPAPMPEELESSRKIETPDMLRWRAEMLLDEMMMGAVDVSAGEGATWRAPAYADGALQLDEHPRFEPKTTSAQATTLAATAPEPAISEPSAPETQAVHAPVAEGVATVNMAAVRAALPPRSVTRMPTPIGRNGEQTANGHAGNGASTNGKGAATPANGNGNGNGNRNGNGNGNGRHDAEPTPFAELEVDPLVGDIADDGRPAAYQNGTATNGTATNGTVTNGAAHRMPVRIDGTQSTPPSNGVSRVADPANAAMGGTDTPLAEAKPATADDSTATGYALESSAPRPARHTTTAAMVDPLEELDAYPPFTSTQSRPAASSAPTHAAATHAAPTYAAPSDVEKSYPSATPVAPANFAPSTSSAPETPRAPARSTSPAEDPYSAASAPGVSSVTSVDNNLSLAAQYSAYAPPPGAAPRVEPASPSPIAPPPTGRSEGKGKLTAVEQRYPRQIQPDPRTRTASNPAQGSAATPGTHNDALPNESAMQTSGLGPVRINPAVLNSASITGAMAVGTRASSRYASLLPRATPWDLHEMEREIVALQEEMARVMPQGHESTRRARHLLEKAQTIFVNDPLRSAEVDYYLTQVKAIVQHSHQTLEWSERYRKQLVRYHWAWIGFSGLMLALCLLFGTQLQEWVVAGFGLNESGMIARNLVPAAIAIFAGSLGASVGALFTMRRYQRLSLGYFDRKYSLRGLVLPLIGLVMGLVFHALFSSLYWAMGVATPLPLWLGILPPALAFLAGFLQENLYGTRD